MDQLTNALLNKHNLERTEQGESLEHTLRKLTVTGYPAQLPYTRPIKKLGRNEPCRCGSGRKYKKCCIHLDELENHAAAVGLK